MPSKSSVERKLALCYVRLSWTRNKSDLTSPERQRAIIEAVCQKNGWIPEWYEDAKGHKTAPRRITAQSGWSSRHGTLILM